VKIAFAGKGGSGKTTTAALFAAHLAATGHPVLALDADINQHLAAALGAGQAEAAGLPTLGEHLPLIKEHLRGSNPRIRSAAEMIKTTPPGRGSRLLRLTDAHDPVQAACVREIGGVRLAVAGRFTDTDLGVACYHSKVGAIELLLNHLLDGPQEYVVVDLTAGADTFASGLFTRFDLTVLVCEPTVRSVGVYHQYAGYAAEFDVPLVVLGNKVAEPADEDFLREHVGAALFGLITRSGHVRAAERGAHRPIDGLEPANRAELERLRVRLAGQPRDWAAYQRAGVEFHLRNAAAWGDARTGADLAAQVDPDFVLDPALV
jgi:CO dehydrogenase maturation factor